VSNNWEDNYGEHDGYRLFDRLRHGEATCLTQKGVTYRLQFRGPTLGRGSWLEVFDNKGASRRYEPGWEVETVFAALEELVAGWKVPQRFKPRARPESDTNEDELEYV